MPPSALRSGGAEWGWLQQEAGTPDVVDPVAGDGEARARVSDEDSLVDEQTPGAVPQYDSAETETGETDPTEGLIGEATWPPPTGTSRINGSALRPVYDYGSAESLDVTPVSPPLDYPTDRLPVTAPASVPSRAEREEEDSRNVWAAVIGFIMVAIIGVVLVWVVAVWLPSKRDAGTPVAATSTAVSSPPVQTPCPSSAADGVVTGNGAGDQDSGPGVIEAFNHAYYTLRSAAAARAVAAPGAVADEPVMQGYIDKIPAGTTHCLTISPLSPNTFRVVLTEIPPTSGQPGRPGDPSPTPPVAIHQKITTVESGGKVWIASINPDS